MKKILCFVLLSLFPMTALWAGVKWEKQGDFYFLKKDSRESFSATGAGANKFAHKYVKYDGIDFLARGADGWQDYGRLNLEGNNLFSLPIGGGIKVEEVHFLAGGNFGNSYEHDKFLRLFGDKYFYSVITVIFAYQDGGYKSLSAPVFWDWFHLPPGQWSKEGARIISLGSNPVRKDCSIFHITFVNPQPKQPLKDILVADSWVSDRPFSDIFAVTLKSPDALEAAPREDSHFDITPKDASKEPADTRTAWSFDNGLDGWVKGGSENWDADAAWLEDSFGRKGVVVIPACNWAGDKSSWIEKKVALPAWEKIELQFLRHSAAYSELDKLWSDGLLKVIVKTPSGQETVYERIYGGEWLPEAVDLSRFRGQTLLIRFENHGAGNVRLGESSSSLCDGEESLIDEIRLIGKEQ
jgi:hypothetical protein